MLAEEQEAPSLSSIFLLVLEGRFEDEDEVKDKEEDGCAIQKAGTTEHQNTTGYKNDDERKLRLVW